MSRDIPAKILKQLRQKLGDNIAYRINRSAPDAAERAVKREEWAAAADRLRAETEKLEARRRELLSDPLYRELNASVGELRKARDNLAGEVHAHRFMVGTSSGVFFHVKAEGDTWEEVISKLR